VTRGWSGIHRWMSGSTRRFASSSTTPAGPSRGGQRDQSSQGGAGYGRRAVGARGLGYLFVPALDSPDYHFFAKPPERPWTHHLHVCEAGSEHERRHLALRDFLRAHRDEAAGYTAFKRALAARHPQGRLAYIEGKDEYVTQLEARAVRWARGLS
jgi:hypothetical protein